MVSRIRLLTIVVFICVFGWMLSMGAAGGQPATAMTLVEPAEMAPGAVGVVRPLLVVSSHEMKSEAPLGQVVWLTAVIENKGNGPAYNVNLLVDGGASFVAEAQPVGDLAAGATFPLRIPLTVTGRTVGANEVRLAATADNMINPAGATSAIHFDAAALNSDRRGPGNGRFHMRRQAAVQVLQEQQIRPAADNVILRFAVENYSRNDIFQIDLRGLLADLQPELILGYGGKRPELARAIPFFFDTKREILFFRPVGRGEYMVRAATNETTPEAEPVAWELSFNEPTVALFTGSASYDYPLPLPPGPGDLIPALGLSYNSGQANGLSGKIQSGPVGFGWALGGTIDIVQMVKLCEWNTNWVCPINAYFSEASFHPGDLEFTLSIDGTGYDLVHEDGPAANGDPGRYYVKGNAAVFVTYCQDEGGATAAVCLTHDDGDGVVNGAADGGEQRSKGFWLVKTGDNTTYRLGYTANSEQEIIHMMNEGDPHVIPTLRWRADVVADRWGNEIAYDYLEGRVKRADGEDHNKVHAAYSYLQELRYGYNKIRLENEDHGTGFYGGLPAWYDSGVISWQTHHLTRIEIQTQDYQTGSGPYETIRAYELDYRRAKHGHNLATGEPYTAAQTSWCRAEPTNNWGEWQVNMLMAITRVDQNGRSRIRIDTNQDGEPDTNLPDVEFVYEFRATALWEKWFESGGGIGGDEPYWHRTRFCYPHLTSVHPANAPLGDDSRPIPVVVFGYDAERSLSHHLFNGPPHTGTWANTVDHKIINGGWADDAPPQRYEFVYGAPSYSGEALNNQTGAFQGFYDATRSWITSAGAPYRQEKTTFLLYPFHHADSVLNGRPAFQEVFDGEGELLTKEETEWSFLDDYTADNALHQPVVDEVRQYNHVSGTQSRIQYRYDQYGNQTEGREFGDDMDGATPQRTTQTQYLYNTDVEAGGDSWLIDADWQTTIYAGDTDGEIVSRQRKRYDQPASACSTSTLTVGRLTHTDVYNPGAGNDTTNGDCNADWATTRYTYGQSGADWQLTAVIAPDGSETGTVWLNDSLIAQVRQVAGTATYTTTYGYGDARTPWLVTDVGQFNGAHTAYQFDSFGRLVAEYTPDALTGEAAVLTKQYVYYDNQAPLIIDEIIAPGSANDVINRTFTDMVGRVMQQRSWGISSDFDVVVTDVEYDEFGRAVCQTAAVDGRTWPFFDGALRCRTQGHTLTSFNVLGQTDRSVGVDGHTATTAYDGLININIAPNATWRSQANDDLGRLHMVFEHENGPIVYEAADLAHRYGLLWNGSWLSPEVSGNHDNVDHLTYGPYHAPEYVGPGNVAQFRLAIETAVGVNDRVAKLDVFDATAQEVLSSRLIYRHEFSGGLEKFTEFPLGFDTTGRTDHQLEYRVLWYDNVRLAHRQTAVFWAGTAQATEYMHDMSDNLRFVIDAAGNVTEMRYDRVGQKVYMADPNMGVWVYGYDVAGNLLWQTDAKNQRLCFFYDAYGRLKEKYHAGSGTGACATPMGQLLLRQDYHEAGPGRGQVATVDGFKPEGGHLYSDEFAYDYRGQVTEQVRRVNGRSYTIATTEYDELDRPLAVVYPDGETVHTTYDSQLVDALRIGQTPLVANATYNIRQQLESVALGNNITTEYDYGTHEDNYRLTTIQHGTTTDAFPDFAYQYDANGNIVAIESASGTETYAYDAFNRLTAMQIDGFPVRTYAYDNLGNIETMTNYHSNGSFAPVSVREFGYGNSDFSHTQPHAMTRLNDQTQFTYDANGNMLTREEDDILYTQTWDVENRLASITNEASNQTASFYYDAAGQRIITVQEDGSVIYTPFVDYEQQVIPYPTVTLTASDTVVPSNSEILLQWESTGSTECVASGAWEGVKPVIGTASIWLNDLGIYAYELRCVNSLNQSFVAEVAVEVKALPQTSLTVNGQSSLVVPNNRDFTLAWDSEQAETCAASGDWPGGGAKPLAGSETISGFDDEIRQYTMTCSNAVGSHSQTVTVHSTESVISLTVNGQTAEAFVLNDTPFQLSWTSYFVQDCVAAGDWSGAQPPRGTLLLDGFSDDTRTFTITCVDTHSGTAVSDSILVHAIPEPGVSLDTNLPRDEVPPEMAFTLEWSSVNADQCVAATDLPPYWDRWSGEKSLEGSQALLSMPDPGVYLYELTCSNPAGEATTAVYVRVADLGPPLVSQTATLTSQGTLTDASSNASFTPTAAVIERSTYRLGGQIVAVKVSGHPNLLQNGVFYAHHDHLGSIVTMSDAAGMQTGDIVHYYPFGERRQDTWGQQMDWGFTGHRHNDDLGLIYMNARYYVPGIGRFLSADTIVPVQDDPQSLNRYAYVRNNPLSYVDEDGHCWGPVRFIRNWNVNTSWGAVGWGTNCANIDMSFTIATHPEATTAERIMAGGYMGAWVAASGGAATGTGMLAYSAIVPATVGSATVGTASTTASTAATAVCLNDGDCTNEVRIGYHAVRNGAQHLAADGEPTNEIGQAVQISANVASSAAKPFGRLYEQMIDLQYSELSNIYARMNIDWELYVGRNAAKPEEVDRILRAIQSQGRLPELLRILGEQYPKNQAFYDMLQNLQQ